MIAASQQVPKKMDLDDWEPALRTVLERSARPGWYGTIRIEVQNGVVRRLLVERSIMNPHDLERERGQDREE